MAMYNNAIGSEWEAVRCITGPQTFAAAKREVSTIELAMKRAVYSKTSNPMDTANLVFQKITFTTQKNKDTSTSNIVEFGISMMGSNQLVRSQKLNTLDNIKFPIATFNSEEGAIASGGTLGIKRNDYTLPTKDVIGVTFMDNTLAQTIVVAPLWIHANGIKPIVLSEISIGMFYDVVNNCDYEGKAPQLDGVWKRYIFFKSTPAEVRTTSFVGIDTIVKNSKGELVIDDRRGFKAIDFLTYGAASMLFDKGNLKLKKFAKGFARLAQWSPYSRDFGKLDSFWILFGVFDETNSNDGLAYVLEGVIIEAVHKITGIRLEDGSLVGKAVQCRPGLAKTMAMIVSRETMMTIVAAHQDDGFDKIIGEDVEVPAFLADENCNKADVKSVEDISFTVLAPMVKLSKPSFNVQLIAKIVNSDTFPEIMDEAYNAEIENRFGFLSEKIEDQTIGSVMSGVASQALMTFAPTFTNRVNSIRSNIIRTAAKAIVKNISGMNLPLKGSKWMRFTGDFACVFAPKGEGSNPSVYLLEPDEILCGLKDDVEIEVVRFPAPCPFEHFPAKTVSKRTVLKRAKALLRTLKINIAQFKAIKEYVMNLDSNILMAPHVQRFRDLTGGSDTDADMGIVIWNKKVVKAMRETAPLSIDSIKPIEDVIAGKLDAIGHRKAYLSAILAPKVGVVCNHITALVEMKYLSKEVQVDIIKSVLKLEEIGTGDYKTRFDHEMAVGLKEVSESIKAMKEANFEDDRIRKNVLADAMVIAKTINDRTIDAPKTGDKIEEGLLKWRNDVRSAIFYSLRIHEEVTNDGIKFSVNVDPDENYIQEHCGRISDVRQKLADRFAAKLNELFSETAMLGSKEKALIQAVSGRSETESFSFLKMMYSDASGLKRTEGEGVNNDFLARQKLAWYKTRIEAIKNMGLMIAKMNNLNGVRVGRLALHASASTKDGISDIVTNNFMTICFPEAIMQMAAEFYGANSELKQEVYPVNNAKLIDGEVLVMKNGTGYRSTSEDPVALCEARLDGEYAVEMEEAPGIKFFVKSDIKELFAVPEVNGSVLARVHRSELKEKDAVKRLANLLGAAEYAVFFCPLGTRDKGQHDSLALYRNNKQYASVRLSLEGRDLCKVLHGKKIEIVDTKSGMIKSNKDKDILVMNILGNIVGAKEIQVLENNSNGQEED